MITGVQCAECHNRFKVKAELAGKTVRCPICKKPLKIPDVAEVKYEFELSDSTPVPMAANPAPKPSVARQKSLVKKLVSWWFVPAPFVALLFGLFSPQLATLIGLGVLAVGLLFAIYGLGCAISVDPVQALSPWARLLRSDAQNREKWQKMAPHFATFWKGMLAGVMGCIAVWISFQMMNRGGGSTKNPDERIAAIAENHERMMNQGRGQIQPPVREQIQPPVTVEPTLPGMGTVAPGNVSPAPPVEAGAPNLDRIPAFACVPNAMVMAPVDGSLQLAVIDKNLPGDRVQVTILIPGTANRYERSPTSIEVSVDDLRQPAMVK